MSLQNYFTASGYGWPAVALLLLAFMANILFFQNL